MKHTSELTRAQKAYDRATAALDKAMVRETAAWEKLRQTKEVYDRGVMAKVYAAETKAYPSAYFGVCVNHV